MKSKIKTRPKKDTVHISMRPDQALLLFLATRSIGGLPQGVRGFFNGRKGDDGDNLSEALRPALEKHYGISLIQDGKNAVLFDDLANIMEAESSLMFSSRPEEEVVADLEAALADARGSKTG